MLALNAAALVGEAPGDRTQQRGTSDPQNGLCEVVAGGRPASPALLKQLLDGIDTSFILAQYGRRLDLGNAPEPAQIVATYLRNVRDLLLDPSAEFSERVYLERNSDVRAAVKAGDYTCGFLHWLMYGRAEGRVCREPGREPLPAVQHPETEMELRTQLQTAFDADYYRDKYIRPAARISSDDCFNHFVQVGFRKGYVPVRADVFDEEFYLAYYADVNAARKRGSLPSGYYHYMMSGRSEGRAPTYDAGRLLATKLGDVAQPVGLSQVHVIEERLKPLKIRITDSRPVVLNVFIPTLDPDLMFGGYIAFISFLCCLIAAGHRVRLLVLEDFYSSLEWFFHRCKVSRPHWFQAAVQMEFVNCTQKNIEIECNDADLCIAYSTWTMHDASQVAAQLRTKQVLFFIQEYEPAFNANDALQFATAAAYRLPHVAVFNSELLKDYFQRHKIGVFSQKGGKWLTFQHAISAPPADLSELTRPGRPRRLICYARPEKHAGRNLFEIAVLALRKAIANGVFDADWTFHGVGALGHDYQIELGGGRTMEIIPKLPQHDYEALLRSFDVGLSLMWAPHPSVLPFEFARAGIVTVTNEYAVRTRRRLRRFGFNIVGATATIAGIAEALGIAVTRSANVKARMRGAAGKWPTDWDAVFDAGFLASLEQVFPINATRAGPDPQVAHAVV